MFGFKKTIETFGTEFAAPTALFYAAKWRIARRRQTIINAEHSSFNGFREAKHPAQIARERVSCQTKRRCVRQFNSFRLGVERRNGRDRRKSFLAHAK